MWIGYELVIGHDSKSAKKKLVHLFIRNAKYQK